MPNATDRSSKRRAYSFEITPKRRQILRRKLLAWYSQHARDLPWRRSRDPYRVWISEVMLQQTQVATVERYFGRFVAAFPNVASLAKADEQKVLRLWEGMGYYRRARQMHAAAKQVVAELGGRFPETVEGLRELPGVGRYTAGAIASIAFDQRAPILEANTIRLLSRLVKYRDDPLSPSGQRVLWQVAEEILPTANVAQFNQALMELGSLVCTPSEPDCNVCPLSGLCAAQVAGLQREIPRPKARKTYTEVREAAVIVRKNGSVLMRQCGPGERWAGLWDFPRFQVEAEGPLFAHDEIANKLRAQTGVECAPSAVLKTLRHGVTRFRVTLDCYAAEYLSGRVRPNVRWTPLAKLPALPLNTTGRKIADLVR
jgi:A/G-specific adenine glycosylase